MILIATFCIYMFMTWTIELMFFIFIGICLAPIQPR